jgi:biopolymer transport protein ExbB/TolQ
MRRIGHFLEQGGPAAWMIFLTGAALAILSAERIYFLYVRASFDAEVALESARKFVLSRAYTRAMQVCGQEPRSPELSVIKAGLMAVENGREAMKSSLGGAVLEVSRACETRLPFIALIASASTLLGLLGTIMGLISTFAALASADAGEKGRLLGSGISEAMYSTAAGLIVGLAAMAAHAACISKADSLVGKSQKAGLDLIAWIEQSERGQSVG